METKLSRRPRNRPAEMNPQNNGGGSKSAFDRVLPHAVDAERALLGSMLQAKEAIGEAIKILAKEGAACFFRESHQKLYELVVQLYDVDRPIDGVLIKDELVRRGQFDSLGGYEFLGSLVNAVERFAETG